MPMTEDELRTALRGIPAEPPTAPDRMRGIETRVRRHRRRVVASVAAAVAVVLLAVPVVRLVLDASRRDAQPVTRSEQQVRDAMMQYAAFVAYWDGKVYNRSFGVDPGVQGVVVTTTLPPFYCTVASPAPGEPSGTQSAWVLGSGGVIPAPGSTVTASIATTHVLWPVGTTSCDPRPSTATVYAAQPGSPNDPLAAEVVGLQSLSDPTRPALDVESVYRSIPDDQLTQHGRDVFAAYEKWRAGLDFGTPKKQNARVLQALYDWLAIAAGYGNVGAQPLPGGEVRLTSTAYVGTAVVPAGYRTTVSSDGKVCVDGSVGGSPVQHGDSSSYIEPGGPFTALDGACP